MPAAPPSSTAPTAGTGSSAGGKSALTKLKAFSAHTNKLEGDVPDISALTSLEYMCVT